MSVGDSITQGVNNSAQGDNNPQYRTSIAAYLAANGYKPKFRGIWRYSDRDGANIQVPDDWAYHCGFGMAAIRTTSSSGASIEDSSALTRGVSKVGYFFELVRKGTNRRRWVWVDMDAAD